MKRLVFATPTPARAAVIVASAALLLAGCGTGSPALPSQPGAPQEAAAPSNPAPPTPTPSTPTTPRAEPAFDPAAFCEAAAPLMVAVPREFVGTPEHVALLDDLRTVSTPEVAGWVTTLRDHYEFDVDVANPESQSFSNFPSQVQAVALDLQSYIDAQCAAA